MDNLLNHRSIRRFQDKPVPGEVLEKILQAAIRASNTGNMQAYSIIVSSDKNIKKQLWESHFKQNLVLEAPLHLTFCADFNRFTKWCEQRNADPGYDNYLSFLTGAIDAVIAAQNSVVAAEAQGLGICYLGTVTWMADRFIEILDLPKLVVPVAAISIGYPAETPGLTDRLPSKGVVHRERYSDYSEEMIDGIYAEKEALTETLDLLKENNKQTLAQVFTDNRYRKTDNRSFSQKFLKILEEQGFMNNGE